MATDIFEMLKRHEGLRLKPYRCTAGKLSIGYGRNLEDVGISKEEAEEMLRNDLSRCMCEVRDNIAVFDSLDIDRQNVLLNMCYNLGIKGLMNFKDMLKALNQYDYKKASEEMLDSDWAKQVPNRAKELAQIMKEGGDSNAEVKAKAEGEGKEVNSPKKNNRRCLCLQGIGHISHWQ